MTDALAPKPEDLSIDAPPELRAQGDDAVAAGKTQVFVEGFTDACLMAQNVVNAAERLGLGANYLGNIRNDTAAVIATLQLPRYTFPVVGLTLGWLGQNPQRERKGESLQAARW